MLIDINNCEEIIEEIVERFDEDEDEDDYGDKEFDCNEYWFVENILVNIIKII